MEHLRLVKDTDEWVLPDNAWITGIPFTVRRKENARALQHGTIDSGDGKINGRTVELTIIVDEKFTNSYFAAVCDMKGRFYRRNQRLYVNKTIYINLTSLYQVKEEFVPGLSNRCSKLIAEFKADDPFYYEDRLTTATRTLDSTPTTFTITNRGNVDTPPVITITATGVLPYIKITNRANGRVCLYKDPQMIAGQSLVIDTAEATVKRNGVNTINNMSGAFHVLEHGENVFAINCEPHCIMTISHFPRWS